MSQDTYKIMEQIENYINCGLSLFGGFSILKKSELYDKFKALYNSLPKELVENKDYLNRQKEENIFTIFSQINFILEQSKTFSDFILINLTTITNILDKMYETLPEDIQICKKNGK